MEKLEVDDSPGKDKEVELLRSGKVKNNDILKTKTALSGDDTGATGKTEKGRDEVTRSKETHNTSSINYIAFVKSPAAVELTSKDSESISEEIIINDSNNDTLAEDHISIPSLHLQSTSQSGSLHLSSSKTSSGQLAAAKLESDIENDREESSKLDIVYVEEEEGSLNKEDGSLKDSLNLSSGRTLDINLEDSLESSLLKSKRHQNSCISQESNLVVSDNILSFDKVSNDSRTQSNHVDMNDSASDPPLQLNADSNENEDNVDGNSSVSDDVIKLDIRGQASVPKTFQYINNVLFNFPPNVQATNANTEINLKTTDVNLSPFRRMYCIGNISNEQKTNVNTEVPTLAYNDNKDDCYEQDCEIEEMILNQSREMLPPKDNASEKHEPECSMSTVTTDYKTLCEDLQTKLPDIQVMLFEKDGVIEDLKSSLQEALEHQKDLQLKYEDLVVEVSNYQKLLLENPKFVELPKGQQLSDFAKHEQLISEDISKVHIGGNVGIDDNRKISMENSLSAELQTNQDTNSNPQITSGILEGRDDFVISVTKEIMEKLALCIQTVNTRISNVENCEKSIDRKEITLSEVLSSIKADNPDLLTMLRTVENKHKHELENLRTYFEDRCMKIKKQYSEEVFSQHSKKASPNSSLDSLDNCPEALPFGSPLHGHGDKPAGLVSNTIKRSHSADFNLENNKISNIHLKILALEDDYKLRLDNIKTKNEKRTSELTTSYDLQFAEMEENYKNQIMNLTAHIQTLQNTENDNEILIEQRKADKDLEEALTPHTKFDISEWPREFVAFKDKCELEVQQFVDKLKVTHAEELSAMQNENKKQMDQVTDKCKMEIDKWKQKRNDAFDKNRNLEETIRERDGLRLMTHTLQKVLSNLITHFNMCEDELNNTFVGELIKFLDGDDFEDTYLLRSFTSSHNVDTQLSTSLNVSRDNLEISTVSTKRVHIAPKFSEIMPFIETDSILDCLDKTQDISVNFKQELDTCLRRLHDEAQELLLLSQAPKRKSILGPNDEQKPTKDHADVEEFLQEHQDLQVKYEKSEKTRMNLEEALEKTAYREADLKTELLAAYEKLTSYHSSQQRDATECPVSPPTRLAAELQAANTEREDMQMQLEAANKQLRSTKQFLEEQAAEREHERDEFQQELKQLKEENSKLLVKNQQFMRINKEIDQLESVIRDMANQMSNLKQENLTKQSELASSLDEIAILRDLIGNLESQLETKSSQETEVMKDLENYKQLAEEKDVKLKDVSQELAVLKNDMATRIADDILAGSIKKDSPENESEAEKKMVEQMRGELQSLLKVLSEHTTGLESLHEAICSRSCSSPSEDVSIRDHKKHVKRDEPPLDVSNGRLPVLEVWQLGDGLQRHLRAEDAAVKRIRDLEMQLIQLKDISQELRMERDVLQERMCEQSLKISSLQSRLDQTRHTVEAQSYHNMEGLRRQLDGALTEAQLLRESLDSKDKQLKAYEGTPSPESGREYIQRLKKELEEYRIKSTDLQKVLVETKAQYDVAMADKNADIDVLRQQLMEREQHIQAIISLQIDEDKEKDIANEGKLSARTLSDILSISEFDEPDLIVRKAEPVATSFVCSQFPLHSNETKGNETGLPYINCSIQKPQVNSNIELSLQHQERSPDLHKEMSLPNVKEESNIIKDNPQSNKGVLSENFSMYPNKHASGDKNVTIQPKKLDFSVVNLFEEMDKRSSRNPYSVHNLSLNEPLYPHVESNKVTLPYKSLDDLGIVPDIQHKIYPDILTQLKSEIHLLREELNAKTAALKIAQEQLSEFPLVKNDMEELERMLQNSLETMQEDKKYYNSQLDNFAKGENVIKEQLEQAHKEIKEKCDEIRILKEDILRRETKVSEIYKEKKGVESQLAKLEEKCKMLDNNSSESKRLKDKLSEFEKLEQMISEKNLQIDSLNENLDKLEDLQKQVVEQKSLNDNLNSNLIKKMKEIADVQQENQQIKHQSDQICVENKKLTSDLKRTSSRNNDLQTTLRVYREMFSLLEKDLESILQKQITSPRISQEVPLTSPNSEEVVKYEEYKQLLSDLENQKSPSNSLSENLYESQRRDILNKIRLKISTLQSELHSKRKELNIKALQIEKAKLEIEDLKTQLQYYNKGENEKDNMVKDLITERDEFQNNLKILSSRLREESNLDEIHDKLQKKTEECEELENQVLNLMAALEKNKCSNSVNIAEMEGLKMTLSEREDHITQLLSSIQSLQHEKMNLITVLENEKQSLTSLQAQDINIIKLLNERLNTESNLQMELVQERAASEQLSKQVVALKSRLEELRDTFKNIDQVNSVNGDKFNRINSKLEKQVGITESLAGEVHSLNQLLASERARILDLEHILDVEKQHLGQEMLIKSDQNILIIELQRKNHELHLALVDVREMLHLQKNKSGSLGKQLSELQEFQKKSGSVETYETLLEMETLLKRNINENIQMSETVRELTQERRDLQVKVRQLENHLKIGTRHSSSVLNLPDGVDQQVSFLYGRYMRAESYRKALIWQKRFLVRIAAAGFIIQNWRNPSSTPVQKFKRVAFVIIAITRMKFLVKRWHTGNRIGTNLHLNKPNDYPTELRNSKSYSHIPSCSYKTDAKIRNSLTNTMGFYSGGKLGNKTWTGSSNPNISLCHNDRLNEWLPQYAADALSEQSLGRRSRVSGVVLEEIERTEQQNGQYSNGTTVPRASNDCPVNPVKNLPSEVPCTSSRFNMTPREPLDPKLHRALFSPREHDI